MPDLLRLLVDPFLFPFMQRALAATLIVGVLCAVVGAFVVWKGLSFVGDALAHASFAGVAIAFVAGQSIYLGAAIAAVVTSLTITFLSRTARISSDTAIGVLFAFAFSLGIVLVVAMLVTPAATASLLTRRFHRIMLMGALLSALASILGLYLSFYANVASGGAIVLVSTTLFLLILGYTSLEARLRPHAATVASAH